MVPALLPEPAAGAGDDPPPVLTRWTARLADSALEARFRAARAPTLRRDTTAAVSVVAAYNCYSAVRSGLALGPTRALVAEAANNVVLLLVCAAFVLLVRRLRTYEGISRALLAVTALYAAVVLADFGRSPGAADRQGVLVVVTAAVIYLHAVLPLVQSAGLGLSWSAAGAAAVAQHPAGERGDVLQLVVMLAVVNAVGLHAAHRTSGGERLLFAQQEAAARMAGLDGLTGIANRRTLAERVQAEWQRCRRASRPFSVLVVDVDEFKAVNDEHGHTGGDDVLRLVAGLLAAVARRPGDVVARYGGDEFVVVLPDTDRDGAQRIADRLLADVRRARQEAPAGSAVARLSVSIGAGTARRAVGDVEAVVAATDALLYRAKAAGRDRVVAGEVDAAAAPGPQVVTGG